MPDFYPRPVANFPRKFHEAMLKAAETGSALLGVYRTEAAAKLEAKQFRWFRWNIRQQLHSYGNLTLIESTQHIRTSITKLDSGAFQLLLTIRETNISLILKQNPKLAIDLLSDVN